MFWLEFNEHVDVTGEPKVVTQDRSEEREATNVVSTTQRG
jgi:hypothetical protein